MRATIPIKSAEEVSSLLGINDCHARLFRSELGVTLVVRGDELQIDGEEDEVAAAHRIATEILERHRADGAVDPQEVELLVRAGARGEGMGDVEEAVHVVLKGTGHRGTVQARTPNQKTYVTAMLTSELVISVGPAGTGKTFLAVAMAVRKLKDGEVKKLVLTRPAVEAGEKLGFLPGSLEAKVNPYLRPLYDALYALVEPQVIKKYAENDIIEVAPLAYMRGRTLSDAFIILDEAQNTKPEQMKMFLTRMGEGSRMVVTGDITQIDLPRSYESGLVQAARILADTPGVKFCKFGKEDVVRHRLVARIVEAYEKNSRKKPRT
jgi:phosphate starvation-inducible PhoH-like protein